MKIDAQMDLIVTQGTTIQLLCFLAAEFPVQFLTKRYGFKHVLPLLMITWGTVCKALELHLTFIA